MRGEPRRRRQDSRPAGGREMDNDTIKLKSHEQQKVDHIDEDISVAQMQIQSLQSRKAALLEATQSETEQTPNVRLEQTGDNRATIFTLLAKLEADEAGMKEELRSYVEMRRDLSHKRRVELRKIDGLKARLGAESGRLERTWERIHELENAVCRIYDGLDEKNEEYRMLNETKNEDNDQTSELVNVKSTKAKEQPQGVTDSLESLKSRKRPTEVVAKCQHLTNRGLRKARETKESEMDELIAKQRMVSTWLYDRTLLMEKLQRMRRDLEIKLKNLDGQKERVARVERKFAIMLSEDDVDGSGKLACDMVRAEIASIQNGHGSKDNAEMESGSERDMEIEIETEYQKELEAEIERITKSCKIVEKRERGVVAVANADGYIGWLETELKRHRKSVARAIPRYINS